jgi:hypothetical protein
MFAESFGRREGSAEAVGKSRKEALCPHRLRL